MARQRAHDSEEYRRNRQFILKQSDVCWLCGQAGADSADHVIPVSRGGGNDLSNLRPAHLLCNKRRGAGMVLPQHQRLSESELRSPGRLPNPSAGVVFPRLETLYTADGSYVDRVDDWSTKYLGFPLMPWQYHYLSGVLATRDGQLVHGTSLISTARQNGKSTGAMALLGWYLDEGPDLFGEESLLLMVSHDLKLTTRMFERLVAVLDTGGLLKRARYSFGRQDALLHNGSEVVVQADTSGAGHGFSRVGMLYGDEIWHMGEAAWEQGLMPTTRTHPHPIILATSTAGDDSSLLLQRWRERGLRLIDSGKESSYYFAEWSPPMGVEWMDEAYWGYANPALGNTISIETLRRDADTPNRNAFLRSCLNLWVGSDTGWIQPGTWEGLICDDLGEPTEGVLACEVSADGARFVGVRAWVPEREGSGGGVAHVRTEFVCDTESEMWEQVADRMRDPMLTLALSPALEYHCPDLMRRRTKVVGWTELSKWTIGVRSLLYAKKVKHDGSHLMTEHVNRAVLVHSEAGRAISVKKSPGPIDLAQAMVWSVAMVLKPAIMGKPSMGRG